MADGEFSSDEASRARLGDLVARQKAAVLREGAPTLERRRDWLDRCIGVLVDHKDEIAEALWLDFGGRSKDMSLLTDVGAAIAPLKFAHTHLPKWMKPEARAVEAPMNLVGARAEVRCQPKGVVGVMSPWNYPILLTFGPLAGVLAAGNRAIIKPSEITPMTAQLIENMIGLVFDPAEVAVVRGGPALGEAFAATAFDHIVYTGGGAVGRKVMAAAAANLTPVTLELGGKSPAVIGASASVDKAATRIMAGKLLNGGQSCLAPDYVFAPFAMRDAIVRAAQAAQAALYPTVRDNPDYTSIISQRHYDRLAAMLEDARAKGATVVELNAAEETFEGQDRRRFPPALVLDPTDEMLVMQDEIFGPILPIKTYNKIGEAIDYINTKPRPLALYYFGADDFEEEQVISRTISGGVTVNDVIYHVAQEDLPFGGVGASGMGAYHGRDGFLEFSHRRAVFRQTTSELLRMLRPPYGPALQRFISGRIKR